MRLVRIKDEDIEFNLPASPMNESGRMIIIDRSEALPGESIDFEVFSVILSKEKYTAQFFSQMMSQTTRLVIFSRKIPAYVKLLHERGFSLKNLVIIGLRTWTKDEWAFLQQHKIRNFTMKDISMEGLSETCDSAMAFARNSERFFLSVNLDVLDPSFTNLDLEAGGMTTRELIYFLQRFKLLNNLEASDLICWKDDDPIPKIIEKLLVELG